MNTVSIRPETGEMMAADNGFMSCNMTFSLSRKYALCVSQNRSQKDRPIISLAMADLNVNKIYIL